MGALAAVIENGGGRKAECRWAKQYWYFRETDAPEKPYDRHHAQIIANFSAPYERLKALGLLTMEVNDYEYRFKDVVDLDTRSAVHGGARGPQPDPSALWPPAGQPQSGAEQPQLQARHDTMSWAMAGSARSLNRWQRVVPW
jgi:hypothetical protein